MGVRAGPSCRIAVGPSLWYKSGKKAKQEGRGVLGIGLHHQGEIQRVKMGLDYSVEVQGTQGRTGLLGT